MKNPVLSVILTHQLKENYPYLLWALEALSSSHGIEFEVWVMSPFDSFPLPWPLISDPRFHFYGDYKLNTSTLKIRKAFDLIAAESTHILLLSDDVVVTPETLSALLKGFRGREMILNPASNSDCQSLYEADFFLDEKKLTPDMNLEDFTEKMRNQPWLILPPFSQHVLVPFPCVSFYCTMIPKSVFQKVGFLDENLEYRCNDQDFCLRAAQKGIPTAVNFNAFAFHFGSKTLNKMDPDQKLRNQAFRFFKEKWHIK